MQTFFTSDTHFDDEFTMPYFSRPFQSVDEMNAIMVERWNHVVTDNDIVYHLGDFTPKDLRERKLLTSLMSLRGGRISRRGNTCMIC